MRNLKVLLLIFVAFFGGVYVILLNWPSLNTASSGKNAKTIIAKNYHNYIKNSITENITNAPNISCLAGIVFSQAGIGRLGNNLMEYASAWSLAKLNNLTLVVSDGIYNHIKPLFSKLSASPASRFLSDLRKRDPNCAQLAERTFLHGKHTKLVGPLEDQIMKIKYKEPVVMRKYIVLAKAIAPMQSKMKEEFTYQPQYLSYAEKTLRESAKGLHNSTFGEEISYVGVHVRLTDYPRYLHGRFGLKREELADTDYYVRAMEYMLNRLREDGISKVVFAVVSDGMNWTKKILIPQLENYLKSKKLLGTNAIVSWCGSKYFINDLVLLSSCNHSIIAYGTFGSWSALMTGGWTVVFDIDPNGVRKGITTAMSFAKQLPHWTILH